MFQKGDIVQRTTSNHHMVVKGDHYIVEYWSTGTGLVLKDLHGNEISGSYTPENFQLVIKATQNELSNFPEMWCIKTTPQTRESVNNFLNSKGYIGTLGGDYYCHYPIINDGSAYSYIKSGFKEISYNDFVKFVLNNNTNPCAEISIDESIPERWYIKTHKGPDRDFVASFYRSKISTSVYYDYAEVSSHNSKDICIFDADNKTGVSFSGKRGTLITIEQFKQLINKHQNKNNNGTNNNEVQRHAEPIGNPSSGRGITTQSRKCTIATTNGYVGNAFRDKPSKATIIKSVLAGNVLVSSHN